MPENPCKRFRLYIAGPMRHRNLFNFPAFYCAGADLLACGYAIFNPAEMDHFVGFNEYYDTPDAEFLADAMRRDFNAITVSGGVALLPGWRKSEGCRKEIAHAKSLGIPCHTVQWWMRHAPRFVERAAA